MIIPVLLKRDYQIYQILTLAQQQKKCLNFVAALSRIFAKIKKKFLTHFSENTNSVIGEHFSQSDKSCPRLAECP